MLWGGLTRLVSGDDWTGVHQRTSKVAVKVAVESMRVCHWEVLMTGAQRLTDPDPRRIQQGDQEPIPQPLASVEQALNLRRRAQPRLPFRHPHRDLPTTLPRRPDVGQERLPGPTGATSVPGLPHRPQPPHVQPMSGMELIERAHRRQLPRHRRRATLRQARTESQHRSTGAERRPQPRGPFPEHFHRWLTPTDLTLIKEQEVVPHVSRVGPVSYTHLT